MTSRSCASANKRKKDAPHYICKVIASCRADYRTPSKDARHDMVLASRCLPLARNDDQNLTVLQSMQLDAIPTYGRDSFSRPPGLGVNGQANRGTPRDPQLPSSQFLTGLTSATWQVPVGSSFSRGGTSEGSCSTSVSVQYMLLPQVKGSGIHLHYLPSTPSLRGAFSLRFSFFYSNLTSHIAEFVVCSSQSHPWEFSESSCRRPQESQWHRSQFDTQYAMSYSRHQAEVRGTFHQRAASDVNEAKKESRPSATAATSNQLRSLLGLRREASLSLHEAKQEVCSLFSICIMYVTFDIESNQVYIRITAPTADNNGDPDARLLYTMELALCRAHYVPHQRMRGTNMIRADVIRHGSSMIRKAGGMILQPGR